MILPNGYTITKDGCVLNIDGKEIAQHERKGYLYVIIKRKKYSVHRLVALAFIPNPDYKPEIDHIDGNPKNNCVNNLRWVTRSENEMNPITRCRISMANKGKKLSVQQRIKISKSLTGKRQSEETKIKRANKLMGRKRPQQIIDNLLSINKKPIICIDKKTGARMSFNSQKEAAEFLGISAACISKNIMGLTKSRKYIWIRK